jgi:asparagine synthase (glutamine-hydrolysing)
MCGFAGILRFQNDLKNIDISALSAMTDAVAHRGPDAAGVWNEGFVGFGHRRLSILDLSEDGAQPMHSANGRFVMVYNGEIYNFEELRTELTAQGAQFRSVSDTEVMLEAFSIWGVEKALARFNGMFAFALWDRREKKLILARDQLGIKPLFWSHIPGGIVFGSEIKSLKKHPLFNLQIDTQALGDYFSRTYIAAPRTIYKNCFRLQPGVFMLFGQDQAIKSFSWQPDHELSCNPATLSGKDLVDAFELEMERAVGRHMRADVPVAAFLSGGNDSTLIAALLARAGNFKTYSIGYNEKEYDESHRAKAIATHLSLSHETIIIDHRDAAKVIDRLPEFYDEPFADASALPTFMLSSHVASYTKVALSGDGADELFAGYPRYFNALHEWKRLSWLPQLFRPLLSSLLPCQPSRLLKTLAKPVLTDPARSIPYIKNLLSETSILTHFHHQNYVGVPRELLIEESLADITNRDIGALKIDKDLLRSLLAHDQSIRLSDGMLTKVDRASMAASLEVRVPFLDRDIIAFSRSMKTSDLARSGRPKKLIKDVLSRYVPDEIVNAPKTGFHIPMKLWLRIHFRDWAEDLLDGVEDPYINLSIARRLWIEYADNGRDDLFFGLWCVLMYRQWSRKAGI